MLNRRNPPFLPFSGWGLLHLRKISNMNTATAIDVSAILADLGIQDNNAGTSTGLHSFGAGATIESYSPVDGAHIGNVTSTTEAEYQQVIDAAQAAALIWRQLPAPQRGEIVRQFGDALREKKESLGQLVSYEMGKSYQEGLGEVQEMIDICDFAVGLSR